MKYLLTNKKLNTTTEYNSIVKMADELGVSYSACYKNLQYTLKPDTKPGRKYSQRLFDETYGVSVL